MARHSPISKQKNNGNAAGEYYRIFSNAHLDKVMSISANSDNGNRGYSGTSNSRSSCNKVESIVNTKPKKNNVNFLSSEGSTPQRESNRSHSYKNIQPSQKNNN